jgi:hypothetical protein
MRKQRNTSKKLVTNVKRPAKGTVNNGRRGAKL